SIKRFGAEVASGTSASIDFTPTLGGVHTLTVTATDDVGSDVATTDFTVLGDIGGSGFVNNILWLAEAGITKGCNPPTNDEFCPDDPVTRGQMAAFLVRFLGLTDDGGGNSFIDDDASMFEADIAKLAAAGITKGCNPPTNDRFCPDDPVTRGQMAAFLVRALVLTDDGGGNSFIDDDGSMFEADIAKLAAAGVTKGCNPPTNDRFCPDDSVTRGQMAAFLNRASDIATS
ncbi:T1SS secreted agglutinin RTX, partial [hydrothermal vent metagenome]